jgi:hypothetical protein
VGTPARPSASIVRSQMRDQRGDWRRVTIDAGAKECVLSSRC